MKLHELKASAGARKAAALAGHGLAGTSGSFQFVKFHACTSLHYALVTTTR